MHAGARLLALCALGILSVCDDASDAVPAGASDADVAGAWSSLGLPFPSILLSSGMAYVSSGGDSPPLRRSSWSAARISGEATAQPCGLCYRSLGVRTLALSLPDAAAVEGWTSSLWLQTLAPDATLPEALAADSAVLFAIEDGALVVAGGSSRRGAAPLLRSAFRIADGRWHHIAVVASAPSATDAPRRLDLFVDGAPHAQWSGRVLPRLSEVALGTYTDATAGAARAAVFVDEVALFPAPLSAEDVARLHDAQRRGFDAAACFPAMPWRMAEMPLAPQPPPPPPPPLLSPMPLRPGARVVVMILSDGHPASAEARAAVRSGWLQLAPGLPVKHVFCLVAPADVAAEAAAPLAAEAELYRDLLFIEGDEDYRILASKTLHCFRALAAPDATPAAAAAAASWLRSPVLGTFDFVVKTDHDVFLRVDTLQRELSEELIAAAAAEADRAAFGRVRRGGTAASASASPAPLPLLSWRGFVYTSIPPLRDLLDKNADSRSPLMTFPPYTAGVAFVLSADLLRQVLRLRAPALPLNEDQAVGLWIAQREVEFGAAPVAPRHDLRFQQWAVCTPRQLAVHPADRTAMRLLLGNIAAGRALCSGLERGDCCLCCACETPGNWFVCDDVRGAVLPDYDALAELLRLSWAELAVMHTPADLFSLVGAAAGRLLAALPRGVAVRSGGGGGSGGGGSGYSSAIFSCSWQPAEWRAAGLGSITPATAAAAGDDSAGVAAAAGFAGSTYPAHRPLLGGVAVSCRDGAPGMPARAPCAADSSADCDGGRARDAICGASVVFTPPASAATTGGTACAALRVPSILSLRDTAAPAPGSSTAFGALREPGVSCGDDGLLRVEPLALLLQRVGRQQRRAAALRVPEVGGGGDYGAVARWILLAALVDTAGACTLASVPPRARDATIMYTEAELELLRSYPRAGAAAAQCAFVVDIVHADGRVTVRRSPLARDAPAHLHYELLRVTHAAPISGLVVTLLLPDGGVAETAAAAAVTVTGLRVAELRLPRRLLPPGRIAAEPGIAEHAEAALRADQRLAQAPENGVAAFAVLRGDVAELPPAQPLVMPPCAAGIWHGAGEGRHASGRAQKALEVAAVFATAALLFVLRQHAKKLMTKSGKSE